MRLTVEQQTFAETVVKAFEHKRATACGAHYLEGLVGDGVLPLEVGVEADRKSAGADYSRYPPVNDPEWIVLRVRGVIRCGQGLDGQAVRERLRE